MDCLNTCARASASPATPPPLPTLAVPAPVSSTVLPAVTVYAVEEPGFTRAPADQPRLPITWGGKLSLKSTGSTKISTPLEVRPRFSLPAHPPLPANNRLQKAISTVALAALVGLGCLATGRSVSAIQAAWRDTDTLAPRAGTATVRRYDFENAEIPGPFESGATLWKALLDHLQLPRPVLPNQGTRLLVDR